MSRKQTCPSSFKAAGNFPPRFPYRLHELLEEVDRAGKQDIISWSSCGTYFTVHNRTKFASDVMPRYCRHLRYKSFLRQLSMYQFQRMGHGSSRRSYHHPYFQRGRFDLVNLMKRNDKGLVLRFDAASAEEKMNSSPPFTFFCSKILDSGPTPTQTSSFQKSLDKTLSSVLKPGGYTIETADLLVNEYRSGVSEAGKEEDPIYGGVDCFNLEPTPLEQLLPLKSFVHMQGKVDGCTKQTLSPEMDHFQWASGGDKDGFCGFDEEGLKKGEAISNGFGCHHDVELEPLPFETSLPVYFDNQHDVTLEPTRLDPSLSSTMFSDQDFYCSEYRRPEGVQAAGASDGPRYRYLG